MIVIIATAAITLSVVAFAIAGYLYWLIRPKDATRQATVLPKSWWVVMRDGKYFVYDTNGKPVHNIEKGSICLSQNRDHLNVAEFRVFFNYAPSEEIMWQKIEEINAGSI